MDGLGISAVHRGHLAALHQRLTGPFTVAEAATAMGMAPPEAQRLLAHLARRGWLARVRRGLYITVPLEARVPSEWREDPWIVAERVFTPCHIGGWSAAEHWTLTEQLFRDVVVITTTAVREQRPTIQGTRFRVKVVPAPRFFGSVPVWRDRVRVRVADPTRTVVEMLDDPSLGGGMRHIAEIVATYFSSAHRDDDRLVAYAHRLGNRTIFKRLGYLLETLMIDAPDLVATCLAELSAGFSLLDPTLPARGPYRRRWHLRLNTQISDLDAAG